MDRMASLTAFVRVVESGGSTAAARAGSVFGGFGSVLLVQQPLLELRIGDQRHEFGDFRRRRRFPGLSPTAAFFVGRVDDLCLVRDSRRRTVMVPVLRYTSDSRVSRPTARSLLNSGMISLANCRRLWREPPSTLRMTYSAPASFSATSLS